MTMTNTQRIKHYGLGRTSVGVCSIMSRFFLRKLLNIWALSQVRILWTELLAVAAMLGQYWSALVPRVGFSSLTLIQNLSALPVRSGQTLSTGKRIFVI